MKGFTYAVSYYDEADRSVGFKVIDVVAASEGDAWAKVDEIKVSRGWLRFAFGVCREEDPAGLIIGDHVLTRADIFVGLCSAEVARVLRNEARVHSDNGSHAESKERLEQALEILEWDTDARPLAFARTLEPLGRELLALGDVEPAIAAFERSVVMRRAAHDPPWDVAFAGFLVGCALWEAGRERTRAVQLARDAAGFDGLTTEQVKEVDTWLRTHILH